MDKPNGVDANVNYEDTVVATRTCFAGSLRADSRKVIGPISFAAAYCCG